MTPGGVESRQGVLFVTERKPQGVEPGGAQTELAGPMHDLDGGEGRPQLLGDRLRTVGGASSMIGIDS